MMSLFVQWYPFIASLFLTSNFINYGLFISGYVIERYVNYNNYHLMHSMVKKQLHFVLYIPIKESYLFLDSLDYSFNTYIYNIYYICICMYIYIYIFMYIYVLNEYMCIYILYTVVNYELV